MDPIEYFISCDWGTTNFRLRLVEKTTLRIVDSLQTNEGVKQRNAKLLDQERFDRKTFFSNYLLKQVHQLYQETPLPMIVISGMASSSIGIKDVRYGCVPFNTSLNGIYYEAIELNPSSKALLVSGVKNRSGVMRGEETQAIGLELVLKNMDDAILVLPGTHSKHVQYNKGDFTDFNSYMTGELFQVLTKHSILANNVEECNWTADRTTAFEAGLKEGFTSGLGKNLFTVRAKELFGEMHKKDGYFYLSGILIGDEISSLKNSSSNLVLAATEPFYSLYKLAISRHLKNANLISLSDQEIEQALVSGQFKIVRHYEKR